MYDPGSPVYKKARKLHLKTTKNRPVDIEDSWTPFRVMEKKFKAKWPPPDLSDVLDLSVAYDDTDMDKEGTGSKRSWGGQANAVEWREIGLDVEECVEDKRGKRRAYVFPSVPGLVYLPAFIPPSEQRTLVYWSLKEHAKPPNETNLDAHYVLPPQGLWSAFLEARAANDLASESVLPKPSAPSGPSSDSGPRALITNPPASPDTLPQLLSLPTPPPTPSPHAKPASPAYLIPKLRWANIGWHYHWGNKQYDFSRGAGGGVADVYRRVCMRAVRGVRWDEVYHGLDSEETGWRTWKEEYEPDAGIVNFYQTKDTLMAHVDRSELCATSPLVSISNTLKIDTDWAAPRYSSSAVRRGTPSPCPYLYALATCSSCPGHVVVPTTVSREYSKVLVRRTSRILQRIR
ncbi:hypothetical protein PHLGIDRAFT_12877 [Phlebiopsis gigantea 11061_1 CR5-6]|uniref:Alpha-ketoglutarate-dependent dioxygenase AlkB-like domain-containing protein n=1 Tax=Phlebiopsis gigantea (strain 11061_1 CR5-6) TaxID=745531 RepID=A0A0C3PMS4_PHLG1|nr:hypothetical protein PHLGIDRAFT_12877 [Phlebiopsis gigantea 11061_1 CR5-6]